ncbi:hypothetical protein [Legionella antarctica]|uniref:hypothetical protein n=1 Tax=Legionella antarctica TaxID=2708020 RepID=UPI0015640722|nr:hypothetical protein [Legionella antarctica]
MTKEEINIIDWEYSGINDRAVDLASNRSDTSSSNGILILFSLNILVILKHND